VESEDPWLGCFFQSILPEASGPSAVRFRISQGDATPSLPDSSAEGVWHAHSLRETGAALTALRACTIGAAWGLGGLFLHGSGLAREGRSILLLAESGGGKSTLTDLAENFESMSDEHVVLYPDECRLEGTPFRSSARKPPSVQTPTRCCAICLLQKAATPSIAKAPAEMTMRTLLKQCYRPRHTQACAAEIFRRAITAATRIPSYYLRFPKSPVASVLVETIFRECPMP